MKNNNEVKVWDPLVRVFHWTLVLAFFLAYVTEDEQMDLHVLAGYTVACLIIFRVVWGFVGTRHARFSDFLFGPSTIIAYLKDMASLRAKRYIGHNPAGGAMVIALLIALAATTLSGLQLYALEKGLGPLAQVEVELNPIPAARADGDEGEDEDDDDDDEYEHEGGEGEGGVWEEVHEFFANFTLMLVLLHIAGVVISSKAHNENLPRAMMTGKKRAGED